ncbi:hypothetical protein BDC45DRAFT_563936 [Circinella umbellata]|nr:hypothetical protein BDC45DRAFT_563936 [Circinella umbellata]
MLILKYNALSAHDLFAIERRLIRWQNRRPTVNLHLNVLEYKRTDLYGHLLGMFIQLDITKAMDITPSQLLDFFIDVDTTYLNAPYHSFYHAVDIVTMLYYMLVELEAEQYLSRLEIAVLLLAALCHDAGHPGYNNLYQVNFKTDLALRYSNTSVLESYSVDITRDLLYKHKLLKNLTKKHQQNNNNDNKKKSTDQNNLSFTCNNSNDNNNNNNCWSEQEFIEAIKNLILSTDMVYHYELEQQLGVLEDLLTTSSSSCEEEEEEDEDDDDDNDFYYSSWEEDDSFSVVEEESVIENNNNNDEFLLQKNHRQNLSRVLLHAADISNTVRPWPISKQWSDLIVQEFFRQGDAEKSAGLDVSPGMDRDQSTQPNISLQFGDLLVQPYFQALAAFLPSARIFLGTLAENRCEWERLKDYPNITSPSTVSTALTSSSSSSSSSSNSSLTSPIQQQPEWQFPSSLLPPCNTLNPSGRRVSVAAGMIVIPDNHDDYYSNYYYYHHHHNKSIRKRQRSSLILNKNNTSSTMTKHRRPLGFRSASHSGTAPTRRRIPVHWASADLLKPIVFESPSSSTTASMLYHSHQDKQQSQQQKQVLNHHQHQQIV